MILLAESAVKDATDSVQEQLWTEVQANTGNAPNGFPIVEQCGQFDPLEWVTHPVALRKTLNGRLTGNPIHVMSDPDEDVTTANALRSVKQGIAAAVLIDDANHWIVAVGCERKRGISAETIDGNAMTHMLVRDPAFGGYRTRMTLDEWRDALFAVDCGSFSEKYIVVGARP
jgi:hypothetical protein